MESKYSSRSDTKKKSDQQNLILSIESLLNPNSAPSIRTAMINAQLHQTPVILDLSEISDSGSKQTLNTLLPMCHCISGTAKDFEHLTDTQGLIPALLHLRRLTDAEFVVLLGNEEHILFEAEIPEAFPLERVLGDTPSVKACHADKQKIFAKFTHTWLSAHKSNKIRVAND